ncbi:hypothetical protein [Bernardetia sp.]|uniref:hypothetical protein n=1 Tax=Bernardetia sp. TaxID=1937974 RepID=UPI0025C5E97C|nr:hypothetical protein [Bernardetia sp.]
MLIIEVFYNVTAMTPLFPQLAYAYVVGVGFAVIIQGARLGFGLIGIDDFSKGKYARGTFGLLFSLAVTIFESYSSAHIASWEVFTNFSDSILLLLNFTIWVGFALELRLALSLAGSRIGEQDEEKDTDWVAPEENTVQITQVVPKIKENGVGK